VLGLDAAGGSCSAALWHDGAVRARRFEAMMRGQSERLLPMVEAVMAEAGVGYEALDAIAVTLGPGGFTGVRIGLAAARGLAVARDLPLVGVSSFEAVAVAVPAARRHGRVLAVLLDAKREELYVQAFDAALRPLCEARARAPVALDAALPPGPLLLAGDARARAVEPLRRAGRDVRIADGSGLADAAHVVRLAATQPLDEAGRPALPIYLRAPDVTLPGARPGGPPMPAG